jgi:hypothetical protein
MRDNITPWIFSDWVSSTRITDKLFGRWDSAIRYS